MFFKFCFFLAAVACALSQEHHASSYASMNHIEKESSHDHMSKDSGNIHHEEHYPHHHPKYEFKYEVEDLHTHDIKSHQEVRDGDVVKGYYTLLQPDGRIRTVHYNADKHSGFNAEVKYSGHADHPEHEAHH